MHIFSLVDNLRSAYQFSSYEEAQDCIDNWEIKCIKDKKVIIIASLLAVIIWLIMTILLFYVVPPGFLIILSFTIGVITGICITFLINTFLNIIKIKRSEY